jgi:hypothetical protein
MIQKRSLHKGIFCQGKIYVFGGCNLESSESFDLENFGIKGNGYWR